MNWVKTWLKRTCYKRAVIKELWIVLRNISQRAHCPVAHILIIVYIVTCLHPRITIFTNFSNSDGQNVSFLRWVYWIIEKILISDHVLRIIMIFPGGIKNKEIRSEIIQNKLIYKKKTNPSRKNCNTRCF